MGLYIETTEDKKEFFQKNAEEINIQGFEFSEIPEDKVLVCLVDNDLFYAAGVAYSAEELKAFNQPTDFRPKNWFLFDKDQARKMAPQWDLHMN